MISRIVLFAVSAALCCTANAQWRYKSSKDAFTSKAETLATVRSSNTINLSFPHEGPTKATLGVSRRGERVDVYFEIDRGQIVCPITKCTVDVRFDEDEPMEQSVSTPADHSYSYVFFNHEPDFIARAAKAKQIMVKVTLFQEGSRTMIFKTPKSLNAEPFRLVLP